MASLKEMLLAEQKKLENYLQKSLQQLQDAPMGTLRVSYSNQCAQYYHVIPGGKKNGTYIPREKEELVRRLAQKGYDEKFVQLAERRLAQIRRITKDYEDDEIERLFSRECRGKQKWICPVEQTWAQQLAQWRAEVYQPKAFREDLTEIRTEQGERVRSKSEKILADYFFRKRIAYKYEHPLYLNGLGTVHPDFTFLSRKTRQEIYWEHHGKMDDPAYAKSAVRKIQAYEENEIYPGERLILTFETEKTGLNMHLVETLAARYLL